MPVHNGKYLTITDGTWTNWNIYGGYETVSGTTLDHYHLTLSKVQNMGDVWGANAKGNATNNYVTAADCTGIGRIRGGESSEGNATDNHVTLTNVTLSGEDSKFNAVYGGEVRTFKKEATGNSITMTGSNVGAVIGGYGANTNDTSHNTVTLKGGNIINGNLMGGTGNTVTGNTLNLSGANNIVNVGSGGDTDYSGGKVNNFAIINIKGATWGTPALKLNGAGIVQNTNGEWATIDASKLKFANPETVADGATMNLIQGPVGDVTLAATATALQEYAFTPVTGVTINAAVQGSLALSNTALVCTASNKASKLTFTDVEWKDSGALIAHATDGTKNIDFNGAAVDTTNIHFTNIQSLEANKKMTLVSSFGHTVGAITGDKYTVGTTLEGKGKASLSGSDLIFTAETGDEGGGGESGGGASFRGEIGATMTPGENSPWSLDLNVSGFAGKKQGFTGGVSVAFMF